MTVTRAQLESAIESVRSEIDDPNGGLYGPGSVSWKVGKDALLFLGGGRAALLQLAHPAVAHAIGQHSATRRDPAGRFKRTFENVFAMTFGDFESAVKAARVIHTVHSRIHGVIDEDVGRYPRGTPYEANDEEALLWVYATLVDTQVQVHELFVGPLASGDKERLYAESKRFARLFGVSERVLPADWAAFRAYFDRMVESDAIAVGEAAREMTAFLLQVRRPSYAPLIRWLKVLTAGLLPERLRASFGLRYGAAERAAFLASIAVVRAAYPVVPKRLRYQPAYVAATRRLAGRGSGVDPIGTWLEHATGAILTQAPLATIFKQNRSAERTKPGAAQRPVKA